MKKDNITYTVYSTGKKVTSKKKYTKFPYNMENVSFLEEGHELLTVQNPFSGSSYTLTPIEEGVYSMIMGSQMIAGYEQSNTRIQIVRRGLDWFRDNNGSAYMVLLD